MPRGKPEHTVSASLADGTAYYEKARQYLEAAQDAMERENYIAVVGNAIHATIAAADAVSSARLKSRWKGDHPGAVDHVAAGGAEGQECAKSLRRVLPLEHQAEYDPAPIPESKARGALRAAAAAVEAADRVLVEAKARRTR